MVLKEMIFAIFKVLSRHLDVGTKETHKIKSVKIVGFRVEIWT
jgi:hypothetical protein